MQFRKNPLYLGRKQTGAEYFSALCEMGVDINGLAIGILNSNSFVCSQTVQEVWPVILCVKDFSSRKECLSDLIELASRRDLKASAELGLAARLAYRHQPMSESLKVAMTPIVGAKNGIVRRILALTNSGGKMALSTSEGFGKKYGLEDRFLFYSETPPRN